MNSEKEIWTSRECAEAVPCSIEHWGSLTRDPDAAAIMPQPFGKAGNARLYDPPRVQIALPAIREWIAGSQSRARAKQAIALRQQQEAYEERKAKLEAEMAWSREQSAMWKESQRLREQQMEALKRPGQAIILDSMGRRTK